MTPEDDRPSPQKTVFRPSPLAAAQGGPPPAPQSPDMPAPPPAMAAPRPVSARDDDVPPLGVPMQVRNPLMAASSRLLALAAAVQADRQVTDPAGLLRSASAEAKAFEKTVSELGLGPQESARLRYAVLATLDDIVQNLPGGQQFDWARQSLVVQAFGRAFGGNEFWDILADMLSRPAAYADLLEVYHACMGVGFQGRYRVVADGQTGLSERMATTYGVLTDIRARPETDLVPHWRAVPAPMAKVGWLARVAMIAAAVFAGLLVLFFVLKLALDTRDEASRQALRQIPPVTPARIERAGGAVPMPDSTELARIRARLTSPCIQAADDGANIRLVIAACPGLPAGMFEKGAAEVAPPYADLIVQAGNALKPETGAITIAAHTDSDPIHGALAASFADNMALSQARAANAVLLLAPVFGDLTRLTPEGRGDREPADRSDTPDAKAKNRRVELIIPRSE